MYEPVDCGDGYGLVREDAVPCAEGLVGGNWKVSALVSQGNESEEHKTFSSEVADCDEILPFVAALVRISSGAGGGCASLFSRTRAHRCACGSGVDRSSHIGGHEG